MIHIKAVPVNWAGETISMKEWRAMSDPPRYFKIQGLTSKANSMETPREAAKYLADLAEIMGNLTDLYPCAGIFFDIKQAAAARRYAQQALSLLFKGEK